MRSRIGSGERPPVGQHGQAVVLLVEYLADDPDRDRVAAEAGDREGGTDGGVEGRQEALGHDRLTGARVPVAAGHRVTDPAGVPDERGDRDRLH